MNKITIVGSIPRDSIITYNNETIKKYAMRTQVKTFEVFKNLKETDEIIEKNYN